MAFEPAATVRTDFAPVPRVELIFSTVPVGTQRATVFRFIDGVAARVRGAVDVAAAGGFATVDTEAPFLVEIEYRAECFDSAGKTIGFTDGTTVTVNTDVTCFHNPLDPGTGIAVDPLPSFADDLTAPFQGQLVQPSGASKPVWVGFGRTGLRGVSLDVATDTTAGAVKFARLFGTSEAPLLPIVCVRTNPKWGLPQPFFALISEPRQQRFNVQFGGEIRYWVLVADEVRPPAESLTTGVLTYLDMEVSFVTYSAAEAAYSTYLAAESAFALSGAA